MTRHPSCHARSLGYVLVSGALLLALPLTASKAIEYLDVPAAPVRPAVVAGPKVVEAALAPLPAMQAGVASEPVAPLTPPAAPGESISQIIIDGKTRKLEDLTPQERAKLRSDLAKARQEMQRGMADFSKEMAEANAEMAKFKNGEFKREMEQAEAEMRRALQDIDAQGLNLKMQGIDHEKMKADILRAMSEFKRIDVDAIARSALSSVDVARIQADMARAGQSLEEIDIRLDQLDRQ